MQQFGGKRDAFSQAYNQSLPRTAQGTRLARLDPCKVAAGPNVNTNSRIQPSSLLSDISQTSSTLTYAEFIRTKSITPYLSDHCRYPLPSCNLARIPIAVALMASKKDMRRSDLSTFGHLSFCLPFVHVTCLADSAANSCSLCGTGQGQI